MPNKETLLNKINWRFAGDRRFDERVFARRWLNYRLNGGRAPIATSYLTNGQVKAIKEVVDRMVSGNA